MREVLEETGVSTKFKSIVAFRQNTLLPVQYGTIKEYRQVPISLLWF